MANHKAAMHHLADELEELRRIKIASRDDLNEWFTRARKLEAVLTGKGGLSPEMPSILWHYLADADIRAKDEKYAALQDRQILLLIRFLRRGTIPSDEELRECC
ncbi:MAG: hypothetical protein LC114_08745 [Bryobacterales bacterium]|jgi:hypothetical protein|nr:hypothetical protein [Bryobacterales bacterium]